MTAGLGLRAFKGGAVVVAVVVEHGEPRILLSNTLDTHSEGDPLSFGPYGVAAAMPRGSDGRASVEAAAALTEGRKRQDALAAAGLKDILGRLDAAGHPHVAAGLLVNRAGWITDVLEYSLAWPDHVPVAEGLAVRDALRSGLAHGGIDMVELDEKSLPEVAAEMLGVSGPEIDARLKELGTVAGKPWRKEQKLACLAAWTVAAGKR